MNRFPPFAAWFIALGVTWGIPAWLRAGDLATDVNAVLADKVLHKATVGIEVYRLGPSAAAVTEVLNLKADVPLAPASNLKVATTSAALDRLGPDFRYRTQLLIHDGDAIIVGDGDPTFGDAEYLKKSGWSTTTVFESWADQLQKLNIAAVRDVIVDDSIFDDEFFSPHWPNDPRRPQFQKTFEAEVGGLSLNTNCINVLVSPTAAGQPANFTLDPPTSYVTVHNKCVTGKNAVSLDRAHDTNAITLSGECPSRGESPVSITIHDPPMYAATVFSEVLARRGIKMTGSVKRDRTIRSQRAAQPAMSRVVAVHETPIAPVLARCNKDSINVYAESLCKRLGFEATQSPGSWENGTAAVGAFLKKAGVAEAEFKLDDGSGLSHTDAISPRGLARVLIFDYYSKNRDAFFASLAIAGVDGTLDDRFSERDVHDLRRRVFGKSGSIDGVSTLCGYFKAKNEQWYVFSIMMNGIPPKSSSLVHPLQEKIIKAVDSSI